MKTLGIFILSDHHPDYLWPMVRAARSKGMITHIHFAGSGVRLVPGADFNLLPASTQITICRQSVELFQVDRRLEARLSHWLVPADQLARLIRQCDRHLFI
jgi:hypothetical protein